MGCNWTCSLPVNELASKRHSERSWNVFSRHSLHTKDEWPITGKACAVFPEIRAFEDGTIAQARAFVDTGPNNHRGRGAWPEDKDPTSRDRKLSGQSSCGTARSRTARPIRTRSANNLGSSWMIDFSWWTSVQPEMRRAASSIHRTTLWSSQAAHASAAGKGFA